ncbi:MAG: DUF4957 domain-containing protein [Alistipes sp.]|nr:DUF4957 domain-containing protein [Alistipes sp.]
MKKMTLKKFFGGICCAAMALFAVSCAQGADEEVWSGGVTNTQLQSPEITDACFDIVATNDGDIVKFTWPVVYGGDGYEVKVASQDTGEMLIDTLIDGQSVTFPMVEDSYFDISVKVFGNDRYNNKDAAEPTQYTYSTWGTVINIPSGSELASEIAARRVDPANPTLGLVYELEAGGTYTLSDAADFNMDKVVLRGNADSPAIVTVSGNGYLMTQAGLKVTNVRFDCTESTATGFITMHSTPDASISTESLGFKADGANQDAFVVMKPIILDNVWIKNLPKSLLYDNQLAYALYDFRINNCLIQVNNASSATFLDFYKKGKLIKNLTIQNNTIWNVVKNSSAYFIRYNNASNSQPKKVFGNSGNSIKHDWFNNTFAKMFTGKDFGNNTTQQNTAVYTMENNNFYDVFRLYQYLHNNCKRYTNNNAIWYKHGSPQSNDYGGRKDTNGNPFATLEEGTTFVTPESETEPYLPEIDLTAENGGVNFKANGALSSTIGDPRWL